MADPDPKAAEALALKLLAIGEGAFVAGDHVTELSAVDRETILEAAAVLAPNARGEGGTEDAKRALKVALADLSVVATFRFHSKRDANFAAESRARVEAALAAQPAPSQADTGALSDGALPERAIQGFFRRRGAEPLTPAQVAVFAEFMQEDAARSTASPAPVGALREIARRARWPSGAKRNDLASILDGIRREALAALGKPDTEPPAVADAAEKAS